MDAYNSQLASNLVSVLEAIDDNQSLEDDLLEEVSAAEDALLEAKMEVEQAETTLNNAAGNL